MPQTGSVVVPAARPGAGSLLASLLMSPAHTPRGYLSRALRSSHEGHLSQMGDEELGRVVGDVHATDDQVDVGVELLVRPGQRCRAVAVDPERPRVDDGVAEVDLGRRVDRGDLGDVGSTRGAAEVAPVEVV